MTSMHMKRNDTAPPIEETLTDDNGDAVDLQGASIRFHMVNGADEVVVDAAANNDQITDGSDGTKGFVSYDWQTADTVKAGTFRAEWEVTFSDDTVRTFPTSGYTTIVIVGDLA